MRQMLLPLVAVVVLVLATLSIVRTQPVRQSAEPPFPPPRSEFAHRVAAVGLVEPRSELISVASHLPGVVEKVLVQTGEDVVQGQPLVKLDTRSLEADRIQRESALSEKRAFVQSAEARVRKVRAALDEVRRNLKFAMSLADSRSISAEELSRRQGAVEVAEAELAGAEAEAGQARASVSSAEAALDRVKVDIGKSTITAPIAGRVLQVRIRPGEFAPAGPTPEPWLVLGDVSALHVRVDIDEHEAWRVKPDARVVVQVRGNADLRCSATMVRFEPLVVPKHSLTGSNRERVDTRVLQAVYRLENPIPELYVGQLTDVFIEAGLVRKQVSGPRPTEAK